MVSSVFARDPSLKSCVVKINAERFSAGLPPVSTNTAAYSDARLNLDLRVLTQSSKTLALTLEESVPLDPLWGDMRPFAIDGSTLTAEDTEPNQAAFPQHGSQAKGIGFPILRVVLLQSISTGAIMDFAFGAFKGKETGEMALARELFPNLPIGSLLLGDRFYPSFFLMSKLVAMGIQGVFQSHAARDVDFRKGKQLGYGDHLVEWQKPSRPTWMTPEEYRNFPDSLSAREVDLTKENGKGERFILVTTLLDAEKFPKARLSKFYKKRWKVELALRDLKDTFHLQHIRAKSPEMVEKVIWANLLSYNLLRWHICNAVLLYETKIDEVSVKTAATVMTANALLILRSKKEERAALFTYIYESMVRVPVGRRSGRQEPRAVKKRPKPHPRLHQKRSVWQAERTS